jgi:hypothetical protein
VGGGGTGGGGGGLPGLDGGIGATCDPTTCMGCCDFLYGCLASASSYPPGQSGTPFVACSMSGTAGDVCAPCVLSPLLGVNTCADAIAQGTCL